MLEDHLIHGNLFHHIHFYDFKFYIIFMISSSISSLFLLICITLYPTSYGITPSRIKIRAIFGKSKCNVKNVNQVEHVSQKMNSFFE